MESTKVDVFRESSRGRHASSNTYNTAETEPQFKGSCLKEYLARRAEIEVNKFYFTVDTDEPWASPRTSWHTVAFRHVIL